MAYELGLIASTGAEDALTFLRDLAAVADRPTRIGNIRIGDSWAACDFIAAKSVPIALQANLSDSEVRRRTEQARSEGVATLRPGIDLVVTITLTDDPDWDYLRAIVREVESQWKGLLFDEMSGFSASL